VSKPHRFAAFVAYLLPVLGWLYVYLFRRDDEFAVFHTKQAIALTLLVIAVPVLWAVFAWAMLWIPTVGAFISAATFSMVMLALIFAVALWLIGIVNSLQAKQKPLPIVGRWAGQIPG
jgi:uncharacterized membrane protein